MNEKNDNDVVNSGHVEWMPDHQHVKLADGSVHKVIPLGYYDADEKSIQMKLRVWRAENNG